MKRMLLGFALLCLPLFATAAPDKPAAKAAPCAASVHRQFDFWIGDWDTFDTDAPGKPSVARNKVESILGGCVVREDYRQADGMQGESYTIYDATRKVWHQSWVTNRGELLILEGTKQGSRLVLSGTRRDEKGEQLLQVSWEPQGRDVREIARASRDGGKTWTPLFDIVFRAHKP
jgi:hypothetical protein